LPSPHFQHGRFVSSQYFGGKGVHEGIASIRRLSRPSGRIETQDASGSTDNPLGLDTVLDTVLYGQYRAVSTGYVAEFILSLSLVLSPSK